MIVNMPSIRVFIVENQPIMLDALARILGEQEDMTVIDTHLATNNSIPATLVQDRPHIILLNIDVSQHLIRSILRTVRETSAPSAHVVMFRAENSVEHVRMVLTAGVSAYMNTTESADELLKMIRAIARGDTYTTDIMQKAESAEDLKLESDLTPRQIEVIREVARGKTNEEIAASLFIRVSTVKKHVSGALAKLGADNRTEAGYRAKQLGLLNSNVAGAAAGSGGGTGKRRRSRTPPNRRKSKKGEQ